MFEYDMMMGLTMYDEDDDGIVLGGFGGRDFMSPGSNRSVQQHPYGYDPHYIFRLGNKVPHGIEGSVGVYSDRMSQWDREKYSECCKKFLKGGQYLRRLSPAQVTKFMSHYLGYRVKVTALAEGCNVSNGYPYWVIFYEENPKAVAKKKAADEEKSEKS